MGGLLLALFMALDGERGEAAPARKVQAQCQVFGKYVKCQSLGAEGLESPVWVYEKYEALGFNSGMIEITEKQCRPLLFYATDVSTGQTFIAELRVRLNDGTATFKDCPNKAASEE